MVCVWNIEIILLGVLFLITAYCLHPYTNIRTCGFDSIASVVVLQVLVMGDGQTKEIVVAGDKLSNIDVLLEIGDELPVPSSVSRSRDVLAKKVNM